jgi:ankyrin repeat protein
MTSRSESVSSSLDPPTTELHTAIRTLNRTEIRKALQNGASIESCDEYGWNAVHVAAHIRSCKVFMAVVEGCNNQKLKELINTPDRSGKAALHLAAEVDAYRIGELLLQYGADETRKDESGQTAEEVARRSKLINCRILCVLESKRDKLSK